MMQIGGSGLLLVGCGKMGGALLRGWMQSGLAPEQITVADPHPPSWLDEYVPQGLTLSSVPASAPSVVVLATKPQVMAKALSDLKCYGNGSTLFISIAAGTTIATFEKMLGDATAVVRAMPNTPASIGAGITALIGNKNVTPVQLNRAKALMAAVGQTVVLQDEQQIHAVTAVSGSGPAYVFALAEAMTKAGVSQGLPQELSQKLATVTIAGAGMLMTQTSECPRDLRAQVTSPEGTTAAGLEQLMAENGLGPLLKKTIRAASHRSRELSSVSVCEPS